MAPTPMHPTESQILYSYLLHPSPLPTILPYKTFLSLVPRSAISSILSASSNATVSTALKRLYRDLQFQRDINIDDVRRRIEAECRRSTAIQAQLRRETAREAALQDGGGVSGGAGTGGKRKRIATGNGNGDGDGRKRKRNHQDDNATDNEDDDGGSGDDESSPEDNDVETTRSKPQSQQHQDHHHEIKLDTALHGHHGSTLRTQTRHHNHDTSSLFTALSAAEADLEAEIAALREDLHTVRTDCEEAVGALSDLRYGRFAVGAGAGAGGGRDIRVGVEEEVLGALEGVKTAFLSRGC